MALTTYTAGEVLTAASLNDNFDYAVTVPVAAPAALVLVKSQAIGTAVTSVTVTDAFSATYETYKIVISGTTSASTSDFMGLKLGSTATGYYSGGLGVRYDSGAGTTILKQNNNTSSWLEVATITNNVVFLNMEIVNPELAELTMFNAAVPAYNAGFFLSGYLNNSTSYTDFTITPTSGNITGGTIYVYGYAKA